METVASLSPITDPDRADAFSADVAACLSLFPVLRAQLSHSASEVEQSVLDACHGLHDIAARAKGSIAEARQTVAQSAGEEDASQAGSRALVVAVRRIVEREEASSRSTLQTVEVMSGLEQEMRGVGEDLEKVDLIAKSLRLLGFNATIEAARAGEHGRTFVVVAGETTALAGEAAKIAKNIQRTVATLGRCITESLVRLRKTAAELAAGAAANRREVEDSLKAIDANQQRLRQAAENSHRASESLASDVARTIVALQFQDRVNQQVTHVIEALQEIENGLGSHLGGAEGQPPAELPPCDWTAQLVNRYTMKAERDIHRAAAGGPAAAEDAAADNVEFF